MGGTGAATPISRNEIVAITIVFALMLAMMATSMVKKSATYDEVIHVPVGYSYWKTNGYIMDQGAPPLVKMIDTLPLLFMDLNFKIEGQAWIDANDLAFGHAWLYGNNSNSDDIVNAARGMVILLSLLTGLLVWYWARELLGPAPAAGAAIIYAFEPTIIAHSQLATLDVGTMFFGTLSLWLFYRYLKYRTWGAIITAAVAFGLYQATKYSAITFVFILGLMLIATLVRDWRRGEPWNALALLKHSIVFFVIVFAIIATIYGWDSMQILTGDPTRIAKYDNALQMLGPLHKPVMWFLTQPQIVGGQWLRGLIWQIAHSRRGHPAYLMGQYSQTGWWYYYPIAYLLKTPIPMILMLLAGSFAFFRSQWVKATAKTTFIMTLVVFGFFTLTNKIDIGVRYLLPIYPILVIMAAALIPVSIARRRQLAQMTICTVMIVWLILESVSIYPDYLTYFNQFAGGPRGGIRYLADSNVDWGQDLKGLAKYVTDNDIDKIVVSYFGTANLDHYKFPYRMFTDQEIHRYTPGIYAVSVNNLLNVFIENKTDYDWLYKREPTAIIGNSIYVYRVP